MTWIRCLIALALLGCTIKIEPLPAKKPAIQHRHISKKARPSETPTPRPTPGHINKPMELEHVGEPTPIIVIPRTLSAIKLSTDPML